MEPSWQEDVRDVITALSRETFTLSDVYAAEIVLGHRHPRNNHVRAKIRQVLQQLRDLGEIDFVGPGVYGVAGGIESDVVNLALYDSPEFARDTPEPGVPDTVPLEQLHVESFAVPAQTAREAIRSELILVHEYAEFLTSRQHRVSRLAIRSGSSGWLYTDLHDDTDNVLYEAKSAASRESVRLAMGQLYDYQRYVHPNQMAVLVPSRPNDDMCNLLMSHAFGAAFKYKDHFAHENMTVST